MPVYVSMLRAVNVGGHNRIKMAELRELCASLGFTGAQTHLQSGNAVFATPDRSAAKLGAKIEAAIERRFGLRPRVLVRTAAQVRSAVDRFPFSGADLDPGHLLVVFLAAAPDAAARKALAAYTGPEQIHLDGTELFVHYCNGIGRSRLTTAWIEKALKTEGTGRNLRTLRALLEMAQALE